MTQTEQILGVGRTADLTEIVRLCEEEFQHTHARPWWLELSAGGIVVKCERTQADAPFGNWTLQLPSGEGVLPLLQQMAAKHPEECSVEETEDGCVFRLHCPAGFEDQAAELLRQLSEVILWPDVWRVRGEEPPRERLCPETLFRTMRDRTASDLHLYPGAPPVFRVNNRLVPSDDFALLTERQIEEFLREIAPAAAQEELERKKQCSFNYRQTGLAYSRISAFRKGGVLHCTLRFLPEVIPTFEELHIPREMMERIGTFHEGLVLVSGMTGSGKSTTVAALLDWINTSQELHILTIESPVEFVHRNKRSIVSQRNVGTDAGSAIEAVEGAMRHDPDVIFIGEMRDPDTIRAGINAASTGHLVISTFHANTAAEVANRLVSFFPPVERDLVRLQLRDCLRCIVCQRLLPRKEGGRVPALEFLFNDTVHIREGILSGDTPALRVAMQQTATDSAIIEKSLLQLVREGLIDEETAASYASNPALFEQMRLGTYAIPALETMTGRSRSVG